MLPMVSFAFYPGEAVLELVEVFLKHLNFLNIILTTFALVLSKIADAALVSFAFYPGEAVLELVEVFIRFFETSC